MYGIYTALFALALVLSLPYYALRFRKYLPTLRERLGDIPVREGAPALWIHAVSVGELGAAAPLVRLLRERFPELPIALSTTTPTGRALAAGMPEPDVVFYFPLDLPFAVGRSLRRQRPRAVVLVETEIWPNFLRACARQRTPVFMVNGRISDRSYPRYLRARRWLGRVLAHYALIGAQSETDAGRLREMGAPADRVEVLGNMKYDAALPREELESRLRELLSGWQPLIVAASTADGEDGPVLEAFLELRQRLPAARLLIAPRKPEQFERTARALSASGLGWSRRTDLDSTSPAGPVLLLDTVGELGRVYEMAVAVFMGGTLVPRGGHNILEAARFGKPVVFGPHMENFRNMAREFLEAGAALEVRSAGALAAELERLIGDPDAARAMGTAGRELVEKNRGATARVLEALETRLALGAGHR